MLGLKLGAAKGTWKFDLGRFGVTLQPGCERLAPKLPRKFSPVMFKSLPPAPPTSSVPLALV
jgi:hypothetical protein